MENKLENNSPDDSQNNTYNIDVLEKDSAAENCREELNFAPPQKKAFPKRVSLFFLQPNNFFMHLKEIPDFLLPLLISLTVTTVCMLLSLPKLKEMMQGMPMGQLPPEQMESMLKIQSIAAVVTTPLAILATVLVTAVIFHYISRMLGGNGKIKSAIAILSYSGLIGAISMLLRTAMLLIIPGASYDQVLTSLAVLLPAASNKTIPYIILANFDFFTIWSLIITAIGFKIVYELPGKRSWLMVFGCWFLFVAVSVGLTAAFMPKI